MKADILLRVEFRNPTEKISDLHFVVWVESWKRKKITLERKNKDQPPSLLHVIEFLEKRLRIKVLSHVRCGKGGGIVVPRKYYIKIEDYFGVRLGILE